MKKYIVTLTFIILSANVFAALSLPSLVYPKYNQHGALPLVKLDVEDNTSATLYEFLLDIDPSLGNARLYSSSQSIVYIDSLKFGTTYYWKYRVKNATDSSAWSTVSKFWTMSGNMTPIFPRKYDKAFSKDDFSFYNSYLTNFKIDISVTNNFDSQYIHKSFYVQDTNLNDNIMKFAVDSLQFGKYYWWRVTAFTNSDTMVGDSVVFSIKNRVELYYNKVVDLKLDMAVKPFPGTMFYHFQIDTTNDSFNNIIIDTLVADTSIFFDDLDYDVVLYSRVAAVNSLGQSDWRYWNYRSNGLKFTTAQYDGYKGRINQPEVFVQLNKPFNAKRVILEYDTSLSFNSPIKIVHDLTMDSVKNKYYVLDTVRDLHFTNYYLRAKVYGVSDTSDWVSPFSYIIYVKSGYSYTSPQSSYSVKLGPNIDFVWQCDFKNIDYYMIQIDTTLNFNSSEQINKIMPMRYDSDYDTLTVKVKLGKTYYARARVWHDKDTSDWGSWYKIFVTYDRPELQSPNNQSASGSVANFFTWDDFESKANKFVFQLDTVETFNSGYLIDTVIQQYGSLKQTQIYDQFFDQEHYWRVKAIFDTDTTEWSDTWSFNTTEYFYVYNPSDGATGIDWNHRMLWNGVDGTRGFQMEIDTNSDLSTSRIIDAKTSAESRRFKEFELYMGDTNYWRIRYYNNRDTTEWQPIKYFVTKTGSSVKLLSPSNGSIEPYASVNLKWEEKKPGESYFVFIADNESMDNFTEFSVSDTEVTYLAEPNKDYYWGVRPFSGTPSKVWMFRSGGTYQALDLIKPANYSTNLGGNVNFTWETVGSSSYQFELDINPDFSNPIRQTVPQASTTQFGLNRSLTYYWRVRVISGANTGEWSNVFTFNTYKVGIDELETTPFSVYPNPSKGVFIIAKKDGMLTGSFSVYNTLNQLVYSGKSNGSSQLKIDISKQPVGIYYLRYKEGERVYTVKIIKQ